MMKCLASLLSNLINLCLLPVDFIGLMLIRILGNQRLHGSLWKGL